jgi:hypothetical protein
MRACVSGLLARMTPRRDRSHMKSVFGLDRVSVVLCSLSLAFGCVKPGDSLDLAGLCAGTEVTQRVDATIDTILPPGGAALGALRGRSFAIRLTFVPGPATGPMAGTGVGNGCDGRMGTASFKGDVPEPLRNATERGGSATWRVEGDTVILDLNPRTRDNNLMMVLPLAGGRGHWGLSTFAGEVARGATGPR